MKALWAKIKITLLHNASSWWCYECNSHFVAISISDLCFIRPKAKDVVIMMAFLVTIGSGRLLRRWYRNHMEKISVGELPSWAVFLWNSFIFFINLWSNEQVRLPNLVCKDISPRRSCAVALSEPSSSLTWLLHNPFNPSSWLKRFKRFIWLE